MNSLVAGGQVGAATASEQAITRSYTVTGVNFLAQDGLRVSEANGLYPAADVVWRGDAPGDRIAQIGAIVKTAMARGTADFNGTMPVVVDVELRRFHGVTERTRYSVGGNYNMRFLMTVRDARTGAVIEPARRVSGDLPAPGGDAALQLERQGQTEKVRVTQFMTQLFRNALS